MHFIHAFGQNLSEYASLSEIYDITQVQALQQAVMKIGEHLSGQQSGSEQSQGEQPQGEEKQGSESDADAKGAKKDEQK